MLIDVLNHKGGLSNPCKPRMAIALLKQEKAKQISKNPLTIRLLYSPSNKTQKQKGNKKNEKN